MVNPLPGPSATLDDLRRFAMVRLITVDLDGTLVPSELAATAQRLLRQLGRAGVRLTVATGRTFTGIQGLLHKLQGAESRPLLKRGTPLILYNGSVIIDAVSHKLQIRTTIPNETFNEILERASHHSCDLFAYTCEQNFIDTDSNSGPHERVMGWQFNQQPQQRQEYDVNGLVIDWQEPQIHSVDDLLPCAVLLKSSTLEKLPSLAAEIKFIEDTSITQSGSGYVEIRPLGSNKGTALAWTAKYLGLATEQVLSIGDNDNDIEMLEWAGIGVAINSASKLAKEHADYICQFGPFQGVVEILRLVHQAHRYFRHPSQLRRLTT